MNKFIGITSLLLFCIQQYEWKKFKSKI